MKVKFNITRFQEIKIRPFLEEKALISKDKIILMRFKIIDKLKELKKILIKIKTMKLNIQVT